MAITQQMIEDLAGWCQNTAQLTSERQQARRSFFGEDDPRPVKYWPGAEEWIGRERRFIGWFMFDFTLESGEKPAAIAARQISSGSLQAEVLKAIAGTRLVNAVVSGITSRAVFLAVEDESFEVRFAEWARILSRDQAVLAQLVPVRHGYWLPAPGWFVWPMRIGPGMRSNMKRFQLDAIGVERMLQGRTDPGDVTAREEPPRDETLEAAVLRMTEWAKEKGYRKLVMPVGEWQSLVLKHMAGLNNTDYLQEIVDRAGAVRVREDFQAIANLALNIWNNTPQPDRGGKSPNQLFQRQ